MGPTPQPLAEEDLHGFVDNEVDEAKRETVLAYLATSPADTARVDAWRQQNVLLRAAFSPVVLEPVPAPLSFAFVPRLIALPCRRSKEGTRQILSRRLQQRSLVFAFAAFVAGLCVALAATIATGRYHGARSAMAARGPALALAATAALRVPEATAGAPNAALWPGSVQPVLAILPSLKATGLELLRGEIRGKAEEAANCLDFVDAAQKSVALCVAASQLPVNVDFQGLAVYSPKAVYWHEGASLYALAAPYDSERLIALARRIHKGLSMQHAP